MSETDPDLTPRARAAVKRAMGRKKPSPTTRDQLPYHSRPPRFEFIYGPGDREVVDELRGRLQAFTGVDMTRVPRAEIFRFALRAARDTLTGDAPASHDQRSARALKYLGGGS